MTPADFTNDILIGWGGGDVFNQALHLAQQGGVLHAEWDDVDHVISGKVSGPTGYPMEVSLEVLDDGTIISHCPCRMNQMFGQVCPHVVALGIHQMVSYMPDDAEEEEEFDDTPEGASHALARRIPPDARLVPARPQFRMNVKGSRASLGVEVIARYGDIEVPCGGNADVDSVFIADKDDPYLFYVRNPDAEDRAIP